MQPAFQSSRHVAANEVLLAAVPPSPRQPSARARKLVFGYRGSQGAKLILGIVFTLMGLLFTAIFCWGVPVDVYLLAAGKQVEGAVVGTEVQTHITVNDEHPTLISFTYELDGKLFQGSSSSLDYELIDRAQPGAKLPVEAAGGFARVKGTTYAAFGYLPMFVLIFPVVGLFFLISTVRSNRREIEAFVNGIPTLARVVYSGQDFSVKVNGRSPFKVAWEFNAQDGKVYKGELTSMDRAELDGLIDAQDIPVVYLREDPKTNTAYVA